MSIPPLTVIKWLLWNEQQDFNIAYGCQEGSDVYSGSCIMGDWYTMFSNNWGSLWIMKHFSTTIGQNIKAGYHMAAIIEKNLTSLIFIFVTRTFFCLRKHLYQISWFYHKMHKILYNKHLSPVCPLEINLDSPLFWFK